MAIATLTLTLDPVQTYGIGGHYRRTGDYQQFRRVVLPSTDRLWPGKMSAPSVHGKRLEESIHACLPHVRKPRNGTDMQLA